jgi:hypothetical protein
MGSPRTSSTPPRTAAAEQPQISGVPTAFRCFTCYPSLDSPSRLVPSAYHGLRPKLLGAPIRRPRRLPPLGLPRRLLVRREARPTRPLQLAATVSTSPDSREGWARMARAAASYARVQADDLDVYYGSADLRRIARANARRDLRRRSGARSRTAPPRAGSLTRCSPAVRAWTRSTPGRSSTTRATGLSAGLRRCASSLATSWENLGLEPGEE